MDETNYYYSINITLVRRLIKYYFQTWNILYIKCTVKTYVKYYYFKPYKKTSKYWFLFDYGLHGNVNYPLRNIVLYYIYSKYINFLSYISIL